MHIKWIVKTISVLKLTKEGILRAGSCLAAQQALGKNIIIALLLLGTEDKKVRPNAEHSRPNEGNTRLRLDPRALAL